MLPMKLSELGGPNTKAGAVFANFWQNVLDKRKTRR